MNQIVIKKLINLFSWLAEKYGMPGRSNGPQAYEDLMTIFGYDEVTAVKIYSLWIFNYREGGDYSDLGDNIITKRDTLLEMLNDIATYKLDENEFPESFWGDNVTNCSDNNHYRSNYPCMSTTFFIGKRNVNLTIDKQNEEHVLNFTGLDEYDLWEYEHANSNYKDYSSGFFDKEEFNYFFFDEKSLKLLSNIAEYRPVPKYNRLFKSGVKNVDSEDIVKYLSLILDEETFNDLAEEYVSNADYYQQKYNDKEILRYYKETAEFKPSISNTEVTIEVPISELIELVEEDIPNAKNLDDLVDIQYNDEIYLQDIRYSTNFLEDDDMREEFLTDINQSLELLYTKILESVDEGEYDNEVTHTEFEDLLKKLNYEFIDDQDLYESPDGDTIIHQDKVNLIQGKVELEYKGKKHIVPIDDIPNWTMGSVIPFNESKKKNGYLLLENKNNITKISIFDFDGTLANTPDKEEGIAKWEESTGQKYPHPSWFSKRESLDTNIFEIKLNQSTVMDYVVEHNDPNTLTIMLTGRMPVQKDQVEYILNSRGVIFDEYHYKERGGTLDSKINTIKSLLKKYPNVNEIEMWEDRLNHADYFEMWGKKNDVNIRVNRV